MNDYDAGPSETTPTAPHKVRRTQAERSATTRKRVCEATLDALVEVGYERISTTLIAQKAEVSRGALTHQFPMRNDLLVAAFKYLLDSWGNHFPLAEDCHPDKMTTEELTDALWDNLFSTPRYIGAVELMMAARQDNDLGRTLREVNDEWVIRRDRRAVGLLGGDIGNERDATLIRLLLAVLRGIAVHQSLDNDESGARRLLEMWRQIARRIDLSSLAREG